MHDGVDYRINGWCKFCELQARASQAGLWAVFVAAMLDADTGGISTALSHDRNEETYEHLDDAELEEMAMKANKELVRRRKRAERGTWPWWY